MKKYIELTEENREILTEWIRKQPNNDISYIKSSGLRKYVINQQNVKRTEDDKSYMF